ncbi:MAG: amidase [Acidobacteriota bacterium]|nr:amidase [Acidobacteriota bacterium]
MPSDPETESPSSLNRREFIGAGAIGTAAAAAPAACRTEPPQETRANPPSVAPFELDEVSILDLQRRMDSGQETARSIAEKYLLRIEEIDGRGPSLRSVIEVNPEALAIADSLDRERRESGARGPLHGIPILIKDNIDTADRMTTTAGSLALEGSVAQRDSFVASKLREAGAVLLGKTNLSEWANFRSTRSTSGWSGRGGLTRNPYALNRNPCGSSSGSGVAASANLCSAAIGTETDGSIVCPSTANGIVGIKPTVGLVSRTGIIPISQSQDTAGPMARTVADAVAVLGALTGVDPADPHTPASQGRSHADYSRFLDPSGLRGARVGLVRRLLGFHPDVDRIVEEAVAAMRTQGSVVVDPVDIPTWGRWSESEREVMYYEFKAGLNAYLAGLGGSRRVTSLKDLIRFNEENADREMPYFGQEHFIQAQAKGPLTDKRYRDALARNHRLSREEGIDRVMDEHRLDALLAPTGGPAWVTDLVNGDSYGGGSSGGAAVSGYPNVTVPAGFVHGLPVGISFFGRAWSEGKLIRLAYAFEQATQARRAPQFRPAAV